MYSLLPLGRPALARPRPEAPPRAGSPPAVPPDVRGGQDLPRAGHRAA